MQPIEIFQADALCLHNQLPLHFYDTFLFISYTHTQNLLAVAPKKNVYSKLKFLGEGRTGIKLLC